MSDLTAGLKQRLMLIDAELERLEKEREAIVKLLEVRPRESSTPLGEPTAPALTRRRGIGAQVLEFCINYLGDKARPISTSELFDALQKLGPADKAINRNQMSVILSNEAKKPEDQRRIRRVDYGLYGLPAARQREHDQQKSSPATKQEPAPELIVDDSKPIEQQVVDAAVQMGLKYSVGEVIAALRLNFSSVKPDKIAALVADARLRLRSGPPQGESR